MQTSKKLERVLWDLVALLEDEAGRNPEFAARLEAIVAPLPERAVKRTAKTRREECVAVPDVLAEFQAKGEEEFRFWLRDFDLRTLKAIVKRNGFDPARATQRWTDPDKFVSLICSQVKSHLERGSAFLPPSATSQKTAER
jgi:hypothetical protein